MHDATDGSRIKPVCEEGREGAAERQQLQSARESANTMEEDAWAGDENPGTQPPSAPTLREATWTWARVAASSFGGPAGQIAVMFRFVVDDHAWVSERRFLHALNYTMLLPGPEAQQLSVYLGWPLHGTRGGLIGGWPFVLPGFLSILALSILYVTYRELTVVTGLLFGLKAAVLGIVFVAVLRLSRDVFENGVMVVLAIAAFVGMYVFNIQFPIVIVAAGLIGYLGSRAAPDVFTVMTGYDEDASEAVISDAPSVSRPSGRRTLVTLATRLVVWLMPVGHGASSQTPTPERSRAPVSFVHEVGVHSIRRSDVCSTSVNLYVLSVDGNLYTPYSGCDCNEQ